MIPKVPEEREGERGYLMVAVSVAVAVMIIGSLVTYQAFEDMMHREREAEMMFRAQEYARAIQRYRKANGTSPLKLEQLMEPGPAGQYFIRQLYEDPLVPDGKWGLLFLGPGGNIIDPASALGVPGLPGAPGAGGIGDDATSGTNTGLGGLGNSGNFSNGQAQVGNQQNPGQIGGVGNNNGPGGPGGGLPIAGVKTLSDLSPFRIYKGLEDYAMWYFTFLDVEQQLLQLAGSKGKQPIRTRGSGLNAPGAGGAGGIGNTGGAGGSSGSGTGGNTGGAAQQLGGGG